MRNKNMQMYRFYMRQKAGYPYPCADYDKTWFGESLSGAVAQARNLNKGRIPKGGAELGRALRPSSQGFHEYCL